MFLSICKLVDFVIMTRLALLLNLQNYKFKGDFMKKILGIVFCLAIFTGFTFAQSSGSWKVTKCWNPQKQKYYDCYEPVNSSANPGQQNTAQVKNNSNSGSGNQVIVNGNNNIVNIGGSQPGYRPGSQAPSNQQQEPQRQRRQNNIVYNNADPYNGEVVYGRNYNNSYDNGYECNNRCQEQTRLSNLPIQHTQTVRTVQQRIILNSNDPYTWSRGRNIPSASYEIRINQQTVKVQSNTNNPPFIRVDDSGGWYYYQ